MLVALSLFRFFVFFAKRTVNSEKIAQSFRNADLQKVIVWLPDFMPAMWTVAFVCGIHATEKGSNQKGLSLKLSHTHAYLQSARLTKGNQVTPPRGCSVDSMPTSYSPPLTCTCELLERALSATPHASSIGYCVDGIEESQTHLHMLPLPSSGVWPR